MTQQADGVGDDLSQIIAAKSIGEAVKTAGDHLQKSGIDTARLDARVLAAGAFEMSPEDMLLHADRLAPADDLSRFLKYCDRRMQGEPVARILGEKEFWSLTFKLNEATLVPRPDTELCVETGLQILAGMGLAAPHILDLGTGSGCILISLMTELPEASGVGVDLSSAAVEMAQANAQQLGVAARTSFLQGSWDAAEKDLGSFDMIVTNPPYIPAIDIRSLALEVKDHDPERALSGGDDGLAAYREIANVVAAEMRPGAVLVAEIGVGQSQDVVEIFESAGLVRPLDWLRLDLTGRGRVVVVEKR